MKTGRWLITGGCGFIGTNLINKMLEENRGLDIRVFDNLCVGTRQDLSAVCSFNEVTAGAIKGAPQGIELLVGDVRRAEDCVAAVSGVDIIVHLAGNTGVGPSVEDPILDMEANVRGTLNMLEAARFHGVNRFVFASSGAPIGETEPPIHEEKAPRPVSPYGASKLAAEGYCSAYFRTFGVKTVALRFGNVYGARSNHKNSVIAKFFKRALNGEPLEIYGDGNQTRDFIFMADLLDAIMLASKADTGGEVFQIATFRETTVNEIADKIQKILRQEAGIEVKIDYKASRLGDVTRNYSDISKAKRVLGFDPKFDIDRGLERTWEYFRENSASGKEG